MSPANQSIAQILLKLKSWCAYQERSHFETRRKLASFRIDEETASVVMAQLISENFLSEERFAIAFAGGKFRMKHWGRVKIKMELRRHQVSDYLINKALREISYEDYLEEIRRLIGKKINEGDSADINFRRAHTYLLSKGYENDLAIEEINKWLAGNG